MEYLNKIDTIHLLLLLLMVPGCFSSASYFMLSDTSRLPVWFENKTALPLAKVRANISLYDAIASDSGMVKVEIFDAENRKLAQESGRWKWHPSSQSKIEGIGYIERPLLLIVEINGTTEIYAQWKRDDVLRIVDFPTSNPSAYVAIYYNWN